MTENTQPEPLEQSKPAKPRPDTKRGNGKGTIEKLPSGTFRWQIILDGERYRGLSRNKSEAEQAVQVTRADHARGVLAPPNKLTLEEFTAKVISRQKHLRSRSAKLFKNEMQYALDVQIDKTKTTLGKMILKDIRPTHIKDVISLLADKKMKGQRGKITDRTMSVRTLAKVLTRLRQVFREAVTEQLIFFSPAESLKVSRVVPGLSSLETVGTTLDFAQLARFQEIGDAMFEIGLCRMWAMLFTAVSVGLRKGEALGLSWDNINLEKGILSVKSTRGLDDGKVFQDKPKTTKSTRDILMPQSLVNRLKAHLEHQKLEQLKAGDPWENSGAVFASQTGAWIHPSQFDHALTSVLKWSDPNDLGKRIRVLRKFRLMTEQARLEAAIRSGETLPRLRPHDLRHTYATLALRKGVPVEVVSKTLGHAKISITLDTYRHVLDSEMKEHVLDLFMLPIPTRAVVAVPLN